MLQSLHIRNLALLDEMSLDFEPGFTAVTGETGAGKSILLGALGLLAGGRSDKTIIRQGEDTCEVSASLWFADPTVVDRLLEELDLPPTEEGLLVLKRTLSRQRAPRITVNGSPATLSALQSLGGFWIDFHGPGEPRRLLKAGCQLELLDLFTRNSEARAAYTRDFQTWRAAGDELSRLREETHLTQEQIDFLQHQWTKLEALDVEEGALEALERDFHRMNSSQELLALSASIAEGLQGEEGAQNRIAMVLREARHLATLDASSTELVARLTSVAVELADIGAEFAAMGENLHFDAAEAEGLTERMNAWLEAKRKHGGSRESVATARDELRRRLDAQADLGGAVARLEGKVAKAETAARRSAGALRLTRAQAAEKLAKLSGKTIARLGFAKADFQIQLAEPGELTPDGDGGCDFLFSPNVGEAPLPLNRIASSGELARVMLALKAVLADIDGVPLLVFDEVDANVGGEIGGVVGEKMASIARAHQVLCVTHLPQVAARAANHLVVEKDQSKDRAIVAIRPIHESRARRIDELARMLGDRRAQSARAHAEKLLGTD